MQISRRSLLAGGSVLAAMPCLAGEALAAESVARTEMPKEGVKQALLSLVEPTRKESGCLCYNLHQAKDDMTQFMFYEQWASKQALQAHGKTPHMKALGAKLKDRVAKGGATVYGLLG
jgi:quinol monooxygenase YgiN